MDFCWMDSGGLCASPFDSRVSAVVSRWMVEMGAHFRKWLPRRVDERESSIRRTAPSYRLISDPPTPA